MYSSTTKRRLPNRRFRSSSFDCCPLPSSGTVLLHHHQKIWYAGRYLRKSRLSKVWRYDSTHLKNCDDLRDERNDDPEEEWCRQHDHSGFVAFLTDPNYSLGENSLSVISGLATSNTAELRCRLENGSF